MIVAIHQPNLLPRHKVLQKLAFADTWVVLDDVQFNRRDYQNRFRVSPTTSSQSPHWVTVPTRSSRNTVLHELQAETEIGRFIHDAVFPAFKDTYTREVLANLVDAANSVSDRHSVTDAAVATTSRLLALIGAKTPTVVRASSLRADPLAKSAGILQLLTLTGGRVYLADSGAARYLSLEHFTDGRFRVLWQKWRPNPSFGLEGDAQRNGSVLDLLSRNRALAVETLRSITLADSP